MVKRLGLLLSAAFIFSLFPVPARCAEDNPKVFTNEDIEEYRAPSVAAKTDPKPDTREDRDADRKYKEKRMSEEHEMEYWCKKARTINRRIEDDRESVKDIEDEGNGLKTKTSRKKTAALEKKLEKAKKRLRNTEGDLKDLEDEAHRKGVPPGWLRCQL